GTNDFIEWDLVGAIIKPRFCGTANEFPVDWEACGARPRVGAGTAVADYPARRSTAARTRSSVAVSATRTKSAPAGP
ncbi:hypothetical protein AB0K74_32395, partial [Streptomyces sp. NPDC056159]|uniref:hypothetical protein n=1 Tax=Streptomyces sp. NPDC056159 TaxID=3155537 RepID=UPI00344ABFAC